MTDTHTHRHTPHDGIGIFVSIIQIGGCVLKPVILGPLFETQCIHIHIHIIKQDNYIQTIENSQLYTN